MVEATDTLLVDETKVAAKVMDGEAIIIDLSSGIYYSADQVGGFVWSQIENGVSLAGISSAVCATYSVDEAQAKNDVYQFVEQLLNANLVSINPEPVTDAPQNVNQSDDKQNYESPLLVPYEEMADLLALDPPMPLFGKETAD